MITTVHNTRLEQTMTKAEALALITNLSNAVARADKIGSAWWADGVVLEDGASGKQVATRCAYRVEG